MSRSIMAMACLLLLPLAARADDSAHCAHSQARPLQLDLAGVRTVMFDIGGNDVDIVARPGGGRIEGRACASDEASLARLILTQQKQGDRLVVRAQREDVLGGTSMANRYAYMKLKVDVPADIMVQLDVGSGDASIEGVRDASADVGSGDIRAARIQGRFTAKVGSGDLTVDDVGSLELLSMGSGDATIRRVRGASKIGSLGSGDLGITGTAGAIAIGSVTSGDVDLADVGGSVSIGAIGSGDLAVKGVRGDLTVRAMGSGDVDHSGVTGRVDVPPAH